MRTTVHRVGHTQGVTIFKPPLAQAGSWISHDFAYADGHSASIVSSCSERYPVCRSVGQSCTTLTSKGQLTIPKEIRDRLKLQAGDRLEIETEGDRIVMTASLLDLDDRSSVLPRAKRMVSLVEIDAAIRERAVRHAR